MLGGDHSLAIGVLGGLARAPRRPGAVLWIDAHGDLNTPDTSPSGNVHGMPVAAALGLGGGLVPRRRVAGADGRRGPLALVGIRSLDPGERELARALGRPRRDDGDDRPGRDRGRIDAALERARARAVGARLARHGRRRPADAPGVGTPVPGGITYREAHLAMEMLAESGLMGSMQVVEVNPILDREQRTADLAVELVCSALGQAHPLVRRLGAPPPEVVE